MKLLKILLIIVSLLVICFAISYGDGIIVSGDNCITFETYEEYKTLNEWFYQLSLREKIDVYTYWQGRVYIQNKGVE